MRKLLLAAVLAAAALATTAQADVTPNALVSDNMVLQAGQKCPLWGKAGPGESIEISYKGTAADGKTEVEGKLTPFAADGNGKWMTTFDLTDKKFSGATLDLTIKGKNTVTVKNALVGEVWVASGQSNMEMSLNSSYPLINQVKAAAAKTPGKLRLFSVDKKRANEPVTETKGKWVEATGDNIGNFSAVAYHFGRNLEASRKTPVGLIQAAWGGTAAEEWTSKAILEANQKHLGKHPQQTTLYNGMIAPVIPYGIKGVIWYQGESNANRADAYDDLMRLMITQWREDWKQGDFPFLTVQLAPFYAIQNQPTDTDWARLREAQLQTLGLKNTGMAVITDYGDEFDIHPIKKKPVGDRLALIARGMVYGETKDGKPLVYSGPMFQEMAIDNNEAVLTFKHTGSGLVAKGGTLTGFTVAGEDKQFHYAHAKLQGDKVVVWSEKVTKPVAVRFGWDNYPFTNLFNKEGLPASPFRTDKWARGESK